MPKRRRTGDTTEDSVETDPPKLDETGLTRSKEIWLEDGNIVLQAEKTLFKVHRGFISRHSPIFADVFSIAKPDDEPTVDECPVMQLHGDSAEDVRHMLLALHDKCYDVRGPLPIDVVAAMIRLGRKYQITHLEAEGVRRVKAELPSTLRDMHDCKDWSEIEEESGGVARMANMVHEFNIREALPMAYYWACNLAIDAILDQSPNGDDGDGAKDRLLPVVRRISIKGRHKLMQANVEAFEWMDKIPRVHCSDPGVCGTVMRRLSRYLCRTQCRFDDGPGSGVRGWVEFWEAAVDEDPECDCDRLCKHCLEFSRASFDSALAKLWENLPSFFDLPSWDVLLKEGDSVHTSTS